MARAPGWVSERWQRAVLGVVVAILSWPAVRQYSVSTVDVSWQVALQLAIPTHKSFGPEILFTYGPLGFLLTPGFFYPKPGILAMAALVAIWVAFASSLVAVLARAMVLPAAGAIALGVAVMVSIAGAGYGLWLILDLTVLLLVTDALVRGKFEWRWREALVLGVVPGVALLTKADSGLCILAMIGAGAVGGGVLKRGARAGVENAAAIVGGFLVGVPIAWLLSRQPAENLFNWLGGSWQIVRGYSAAMGDEDPTALWEYSAAVVVVVALLALVWTTTTRSRSVRVAIAMVLAAGLYPLFRSGFTRHPDRGLTFFVAFLVVPLAFVTVWSKRQVLLFVCAAAVVVLGLARITLSDLLDFDGRVSSFGDTTELIASSSRRAEWIDEQRTAFSNTYAIPPRMLDEVGSRTVHVVPWESAVLFAYPGLRWDPLPIFQDYAAYTEALDDRNADALTGSNRPDFIFRQPGASLDGRLARFDPPRQNLELLCRYHLYDRTPTWELLRADENRCGRIVEGRTREVRLGEVVATPAYPGDIVLARFSGIASSLEDRVETLLLRGPEYYMGSGRPGEGLFRFVQGTQGSWHVMTAPACAANDLAGTGPSIPTFVLSDHLGAATGEAMYGVEFAHVSYLCPGDSP
jgi:hypothetical protein